MDYSLHLSKDKKLKKLIGLHDLFQLKQKKNICIYLCASIMSQQLSTKVATVIYNRFLNLFGNKEPTPQQILDISLEKLRSIGLSNAKASYVHNVARFAEEKGLNLKKLNRMSNEELVEYLTEIKGVGKWTTEMLLMFALGREDVFAVDDLGIQNAMIGLYRLNKEDKKQLKLEMQRISAKWSPYRTYACLHLWRWKDNTPIKGKK
ncbi:MAG: DNA-3-methyladenine glycosylase 2 family protein [Chitinophagaceae bacterium]|nr:DNA-3-methyladenine glycosylase 2 family protein [Chitinophagaceae bacterium]